MRILGIIMAAIGFSIALFLILMKIMYSLLIPHIAILIWIILGIMGVTLIRVSQKKIKSTETECINLEGEKKSNTHLIRTVRKKPNASKVTLSFTKITDLSPLSELSNLNHLVIDWCDINDLSPLAKLTKLNRLEIYGKFGDTSDKVPVIDFSPLIGLKELVELSIVQTNVKDISPLSKLTSLRKLRISNCPGITDLKPLSGIRSLESLTLNCSQINGITPLSELPNLTSLDLDSCNKVKLSELSKLKPLVHLSLPPIKFSDDKIISRVERAKKLTRFIETIIQYHQGLQSLSINLDGSCIELSGLLGLTQLRTLRLKSCADYIDFSPLIAFPNLTELDLNSGSKFESISPLSKVPNLKKLSLHYTEGLSDVTELGKLRNLNELDLQDCKWISGKLIQALQQVLPNCHVKY